MRKDKRLWTEVSFYLNSKLQFAIIIEQSGSICHAPQKIAARHVYEASWCTCGDFVADIHAIFRGSLWVFPLCFFSITAYRFQLAGYRDENEYVFFHHGSTVDGRDKVRLATKLPKHCHYTKTSLV